MCVSEQSQFALTQCEPRSVLGRPRAIRHTLCGSDSRVRLSGPDIVVSNKLLVTYQLVHTAFTRVKVRIHLRQKLINLINLHKVEHITSREAQEAQGTQLTQAVDVNASALNLMLCPKQLTRKRRCLCGAFVTRRGAWAPWVEKS